MALRSAGKTCAAFIRGHMTPKKDDEQWLPNLFREVLNMLYSLDQSYDSRVARGDRYDRYGIRGGKGFENGKNSKIYIVLTELN